MVNVVEERGFFITPIFSGGKGLPRIPKGIWSKVSEQNRSERYLRLVEDLVRFTAPIPVLTKTKIIEVKKLYSKHFSLLLEALSSNVVSFELLEQIFHDMNQYLFNGQISDVLKLIGQKELELLKEIIQCGLFGECWRELELSKTSNKSKLFKTVYGTSFYQHLFELSRCSNFVFEVDERRKTEKVSAYVLLKEFLFDFLPFRVQTKLIELEKSKSVIDEETEKAKEILEEFLYGFLDRSTIVVDSGKEFIFRPIFYISNDAFPRIHSLCSQELKGEYIYQVLKNSIEEFVEKRQTHCRHRLNVKYIDVKNSLLRFFLYDFVVNRVGKNISSSQTFSYQSENKQNISFPAFIETFEQEVILNEDLDLYELFVAGLERILFQFYEGNRQKQKSFASFVSELKENRNKVKRLVSTILNFGLSSHGVKELLDLLEFHNSFQQQLNELITTKMLFEPRSITNEVFLSELLALLILEQLLRNYKIYLKQGKEFYERFIKRPKNLLNFLLQFRFNNYFLFREIEKVISSNRTTNKNNNDSLVLLMDYKFDGYVLLTVEGN